MTVNKETQVEIRDGDMELLREVERRGFIQIRFKKIDETLINYSCPSKLPVLLFD